MPQLQKVFFSYPHAERALADRLRSRLVEQGIELEVFDSSNLEAASGPEGIDQHLRSADAVVLMINPRSKLDAPQQRVWRSVLAAAWENSDLRILPLLLRDAELPPFVQSAAPGSEVQAIRIQDESDLDRTVEAVREKLGMLENPTPSGAPPKSGVARCQSPASFSLEIYPSADGGRDVRRERLSELRVFAEQLKH